MADICEEGMSRLPILVILGATGSGKTKLSIQLAQKFAGEIISADSMQVYKELDIITAKVTKEERLQAPHHMIDIVDPLVNYTVIDFRNRALSIIDNLITRRKLPIVVGGTNYYIESLLWQILIDDPEESNDSDQQAKKPRLDTSETNEELHKKLAQVDPQMAQCLHPNNRRKVIRSLEIYEKFGRQHSELLKLQRTGNGCGLGGPLRYKNLIILWLRCDQEVLDSRLDERVDTMVEAGLIQELLDFHERYNEDRLKNNAAPDYTKGIFQSIGFKEFHNYLILPEDERNSQKGQQMLQESIAELKLVTRRYARRQRKWIMNRMIRRTDRQVPSIYSLNCTNIDKWTTDVLDPASEIVSSALRGEKPKQKVVNENIEKQVSTDVLNDMSHFCEVCERIFVGELQWNIHLKSIKHQKVMEKKKRSLDEQAKNNLEQSEQQGIEQRSA